MRCKFCFATFQDVKSSILPKGHLGKAASLAIVAKLARHGFEKITLAGGEPTLCPWLPELIREAKNLGMTTMVVTNGSNLSERWLDANASTLDWIALSVDSAMNRTNLKTGRAIVGKHVITAEEMVHRSNLVRSAGVRLKVNTVVTSANLFDDLALHLIQMKPERWKIFQALPVAGQNDIDIEEFLVTKEQFEQFIARHSYLDELFPIVTESNTDMRGSYVMVDPAGRFYDSMLGRYTYSRAILDVGVKEALKDIVTDVHRFKRRGGFYDW